MCNFNSLVLVLIYCILGSCRSTFAADPVPVSLGSGLNPALPEEGTLYPSLVWAEKYPLSKTLHLLSGASTFIGDKFIVDWLFAKRNGVECILVSPMRCSNDRMVIKFVYFVDSVFLSIYNFIT